MLDLHVHVLPGIDDGPRTMEDALALAQALADDGIEHIVATPHIYPGVFDNSATRIGEAFDAFQAAVSDAGIDLTMTWAAEVRICPEILDWIELRRLPMLNGSLVGPSTALIELPDGQIPVGTDKLMGMMLDRGITPLMAHPERNKAVMEQPTRLDALRRLGCKFQVTAGSLLGDFGSRAQTTAQKLLDAGWVDVIATDSHNRSSRRPRMRAARDWLTEHFDEALALRLTKTHPTDIAGLSSFTVQAGAQRLVFRDLPAMAPLEATDQWSVDLMLGADTQASAVETSVPGGSAEAAWSLVDFRIDEVVNELQGASLRNEFHAEGTMPTQATPTAREASDESEDWQLPTYRPDTPTRSSTKAQEPVPTPVRPTLSKVVKPEPIKVQIEASSAAVVVPEFAAVAQGQAAPPPPPPATPAEPRSTMQAEAPQPILTKGFRLNEVSTREAAPTLMDAIHPRPAAMARAGSMAQAGSQARSLAAIARSVTLAARVESTEQPERPATSDGPRQGFRLRDLNPLPNRRR
jgi:tyrosine-protein phosphatase YwqE